MTKIDFIACVTLKRKKGVPPDLFHAYWRDVHSFALALVESGHVLKLRLHLLDEHDNTNPPNESELSQSVLHYKLLEKQYQALMEIAFADRVEMSRCFASLQYVATIKGQPKFIRQIHTLFWNWKSICGCVRPLWHKSRCRMQFSLL